MAEQIIYPDLATALPDNRFFVRLLDSAERRKGDIMIDDSDRGIAAGYDRFFRDVISLRQKIRESLPAEVLDERGFVRAEEEIYICALFPASYHSMVAFIATVAIGAVSAAISSAVPVEEAVYSTDRCKASIIIVGSELMERAVEIQTRISQEHGRDLKIINTDTVSDPEPLQSNPHIDSRIAYHFRRPALVLFTSEIEGRPKGVVHCLEIFHALVVSSSADHLYLCHSSMRWGLGMTTAVSSVMDGVPLRILGSSSKAARVWDAIRDDRPTSIQGIPCFWYTMMKHYNNEIAGLPAEERARYIEGLKYLKSPFCAGASPTPYARRWWKELLGYPLLQGFGYTDTPYLTATSPESHFIYMRSYPLGRGDDNSKFSEELHGEILTKSPRVFIKYLGDEAATQAVLDDDGYYRTGNQLYYEEGYGCVIDGRMTITVSGIEVDILNLEHSLKVLPYITEAYVSSVPDTATGQRVAALVRSTLPFKMTDGPIDLSAPEFQDVLTLHKLRADLIASGVSRYKLPTLLRVLRDGEDFPKILSTSKLLRQDGARTFFPLQDEEVLEPLPEEVQVLDIDY